LAFGALRWQEWPEPELPWEPAVPSYPYETV